MPRDKMRFAVVAALSSGLVSACSPSRAVALDPKNDVHCSVLAFYFNGLAAQVGAPDRQLRASKGLHDWYAAKMKIASAGRFSDPAVLQAELGPLLEEVKADPLSAGDELQACADRAAADPSFNRFARTYMHP